jgi:hypothetical protein
MKILTITKKKYLSSKTSEQSYTEAQKFYVNLPVHSALSSALIKEEKEKWNETDETIHFRRLLMAYRIAESLGSRDD